jgi:hypothetical protein
MAQGAATSLAKYIFGEVLGDIVYAPVWWYSRGLFWVLHRLRNKLINFERALGLRFWLRTLGKPMYGQRDIAGKIISFFMRLFVLFFRFIAFVLFVTWLLVLLVLWLIVPPLIIWQLLHHFVGLLTT